MTDYIPKNKKKTDEDYYSLAELRGFEWLGNELPQNSRVKTLWRCEQGHEWQARYNDLQQGVGCPYCAHKARITEEDYYSLESIRGFKWVGNAFPRRTSDKTWWQCSEGHIWEACYNDVKNRYGCPNCAGRVRKTEIDYRALAESRGFEWISDKLPPNNHTKTLWRCGRGHEWETTYTSIASHNSGCHVCKRIVNGVPVSKIQLKIADMFYDNEYITPEVNFSVGKYKVDLAFPELMLAIEYDSRYWHRDQEEQDSERVNYLLSLGWKILIIRSGKLIPDYNELCDELNLLLNDSYYSYRIMQLVDWSN